MQYLIAAFFGLFLAVSPAWADGDIKLDVVITDSRGAPLKDPSQATKDDPTCDKCIPLTAAQAVAMALLTDQRDEIPAPTAIEKAKRGKLALEILDRPAAVKMTAQQITEVSKLMKIWGPIVDARVLPMLDPNLDLNK